MANGAAYVAKHSRMPESAMRYSAASDELVAQARLQAGQQLRRVRRKLGLSQAEAATIAGGGHALFPV